MLILNNLDVALSMTPILNKVSLTVDKAEAVALLGRNGAGKSTVLNTIAGLLQPTAGSLSFCDKNILPLRAFQRARAGIAFVPQGRGIFPHLTVEENLILGLQSKATVPEYLYDLFPILTRLRNRKGGMLSGGEQQQLAIARALVMKPQFLMLDEPTEGIQPSIVQEISHALIRIQKEFGIAILLVEQYLEFAWNICSRYYVLQRGEIIREGNTASESYNEIIDLLSI